MVGRRKRRWRRQIRPDGAPFFAMALLRSSNVRVWTCQTVKNRRGFGPRRRLFQNPSLIEFRLRKSRHAGHREGDGGQKHSNYRFYPYSHPVAFCERRPTRPRRCSSLRGRQEVRSRHCAMLMSQSTPLLCSCRRRRQRRRQYFKLAAAGPELEVPPNLYQL